MELAFAGVHQLCAPMLHHLERLPDPQREALGTAFGLVARGGADRFLVGLAVLGLLSAAAEERPVVCLVDDAHWLDQVSMQILAFVARRLLAESVLVLFAVREPNDATELDGLPERTLGGLSNDDARALLHLASPGRLDERVRDRIVAETRGNPLALLELPRGLTAAELAGGFALPGPRPLASQIEQRFLERVKALPAPTQRLLLLAAAEPVGDVALLRRAAEQLGIGPGAEAPAEEASLIEFGAQVRFRHPLVRSAAYRAASLAARRSAHRALSEVTDPEVGPDRRAWHRAAASATPDEAAAADLVRSAERAQARGGIAAAAAFLERATELTADPARRASRALAAAQAKFEAAAPQAAEALISAAEIGPLDALQRARLLRLRAQIAFVRRRGSDAPPLLLDAARQLERLDRRLSRETYLEALGAAMFAGRLGGDPDEREIAEAARYAPVGPIPPQATDLLLDGIATRYTEGYAAGVAPLRQALEAFRDAAEDAGGSIMRWLWLACPVAPEPVAPDLWDDETWHALASRAVDLAREAGALGVLPVALSYRAGVHVHAGEFAAAAALIDEADTIASAIGSRPLKYTSLALAAWRGEETQATNLIAAATQDATARGEGRAIGLIGYATAVLYNGLGHYDKALAGAQAGCQHDDLGFFGWSLVELVEAAVRSDAPEAAAGALAQLEERATAAGSDWALGVLARSKALLSSGVVADAYYSEAIERLGRSRITVHLARAHLLHGEWLRRENRRLDAREQLRTAYGMLDGMGARAFAQRAQRELLATGETARARTVNTRADLTPQEAQIARLAAQGHTNREIGSELFISPRTVEYHLSKVFTKLGLTTRRGLRRALTQFDQ
jgi:DNA-binding CsgD family transcriptional regulator